MRYKNIICLTAMLLACFFVNFSAAALENKPVVYLDPDFGGSQLGPHLDNNQYGKNITLKLSKKIKSAIESKGFVVVLSREEDKALEPDERLLKATRKKATLYIAITLMSGKENCIKIHRWAGSGSTHDDAGRILSSYSAMESKKFSESLQQSLDKGIGGCVQLSSQNISDELLYILRNVHYPSVAINFELVKPKSASSYRFPFDAAAEDRMAEAIASGVQEYLKNLTSP